MRLEMKAEQLEILGLLRLPGVLTPEQCAAVTGFTVEEITIISAARILVPLGNPKHNEKRLFASVQVERFVQDVSELTRARVAIKSFWHRKNLTRTGVKRTAEGERGLAHLNGSKTIGGAR